MTSHTFFKVLIYSLLLILLNCSTEFQKNTRILVEGTVIDNQGNAIPDAEISVYTNRSTGSIFSVTSGSDEFLLGRNYSDNDGDFSVISLFDRVRGFDVEVKVDNNFASYFYRVDTVDYVPEDFIFDLQNVTLNEISNVDVAISRISGMGNSISYSFNYLSASCFEVYVEDELDSSQSFCNSPETLSRTLNDDNPDRDDNFVTTVNSQVDFVYSINGESEITETFTVNSPDFQFNFSY